jgi:hypothetical protein
MADSEKAAPKKLKMEKVVGRLREIEDGLRDNLDDLHEQLCVIESKPELLSRLELFRSDMETKATTLEADVKKLRDDVKTIKDLLGLNLKKQSPKNS